MSSPRRQTEKSIDIAADRRATSGGLRVRNWHEVRSLEGKLEVAR